LERGATSASGAPRAIVIPLDNDDYSRLVARAEADDQSVDFRALRFAWLDSAARLRSGSIDQLSRDMSQTAKDRNAVAVRDAAQKILSIDYTDMAAHKFLRQSCHILGDAVCEAHEHFVEFGLITSITRGKDGKSMATAWEVASLHEEYFIMSMAGLRPGTQYLVNAGHRAYDKFDVTDETGAPHVVFFDITLFLPKEIPGLK
jgi:hypothetical protein